MPELKRILEGDWIDLGQSQKSFWMENTLENGLGAMRCIKICFNTGLDSLIETCM